MTLGVVTGASRGIGRALARLLAARGADLALIGRRSEAQATLLAELAREGRRATQIGCELADASDVERAAAEVLDLGVPDAVVHNAGVVARGCLVEDESLERWNEQLAVNLTAPFLLTRGLLPAMKARRSGRIVFVGSISSTLGTAGQAAYNASKWGLVGLMKSLAEELMDTGLSTCAILPGGVDTDMLRGSSFPPRMSAEDVARTLTFFALDAPVAHNGGVQEMFGV